jgi:DNA-binding MarR family transcriptional regulator
VTTRKAPPAAARPAGPGDSPGFLLWRATLRWQRGIAAALVPYELTHVQFVLLVSLAWLNSTGAHPNQLTLARHAAMDVKMVSQVIGRLVARGLVKRDTDPADTRAKLLRITDAGAALARDARRAVEAADEEFFAAVTDRAGLLRVLGRLADY